MPNKKRGRGRPKLETSRRLSILLGLRVNEEQRTRYQEAADAAAKDLLDWARDELDAAAAKALGRK